MLPLALAGLTIASVAGVANVGSEPYAAQRNAARKSIDPLSVSLYNANLTGPQLIGPQLIALQAKPSLSLQARPSLAKPSLVRPSLAKPSQPAPANKSFWSSLSSLFNTNPTPQPQAQALTPSDDALLKAANYPAIDVWVKQKMNELNLQRFVGSENDNTQAVAYLTDEDQLQGNTPFPNGITNYQRMESSGDNLNCLIHAVLTALSPTFRTLEKAGKDSIARYFRTVIAVEIYKQLITRTGDQNGEFKDRLADLVRGHGDLDVSIAGKLGEKYHFGVFLRDRTTPATKWAFLGDTDQNAPTPFIMIYNPGESHFEAIRYPNSNTYLFPQQYLDDWLASRLAIDI